LVTLIKPANAKDFLLNPSPLTHIFLVLALISAVVGIILLLKKLKNSSERIQKKKYLSYGIVRVAVLFFILLLSKTTFIAVQQIKNKNINTKVLVQSLLFASS